MPRLCAYGLHKRLKDKTVVVDKKKAPIIRKAFELYAQNNSRLEDISNFLAKKEIVSRSGKF